MILENLAVGAFMSNCYFVGSEKTRQGLVIDPGADAREIIGTIRRLGLKVETVAITHGHVDHISATREVVDETGARLAIHELEGKGEHYQALASMLASFLGGEPAVMPEPDLLLNDGDELMVGELRFKVLHTPGHSPGGICIVGEGVAFTGDTLFNMGIGRTDFPGCSMEALMRSIREKLMTLPDETVVYPGHGPSTTIGEERRGNPFLNMRGI